MVKVEADQQTSEAQLEGALKSRLQHFRDNSSSLSLVGIRRLLEEDLGLEKYALDVHKSFIKQFIDKNLHADEDADSKKSEGKVAEEVYSTINKDKDLSGVSRTDEAKLEEDSHSPIKGVLNSDTEKVSSSQENEISESMIKKAIQERAVYIRSQSETLTLAGARRYLEEDLKLSKNALDPFKKFVRQEIEKVIDSGVVSTSATVAQKESSRMRQSSAARSTSSKGRSGSIDSENDAEAHKEKPREKSIQRDEAEKLDKEKKRKRIEKKTDVAVKTQSKLAKKQLQVGSDADNDNDNGASVSEDDEPQSSAEKPAKKKEAPSSVYGKHVEHLKSVIKACGMSIAPTVYKKAKMVPDSKREAFLMKELEGVLLKEGLSKNPSEKEIKEVRKRKERAKELEGIDMSNIITSSRRRSTMSFVPPPRPKKKEGNGDDVMSTKKDKDDGKDADKKEEDDVKDADKKEEDDVKDADKKEEDDVKDADKKEEDDVKDAKKKEDNDHEDGKKKEDDDDDEDDEEEDDEDDDDEDDSQNDEFDDDDEGSD